jgi:hypothetical protein
MLSGSITTLASFDDFDGNGPSGVLVLSGSTPWGLTEDADTSGGGEVSSWPPSVADSAPAVV